MKIDVKYIIGFISAIVLVSAFGLFFRNPSIALGEGDPSMASLSTTTSATWATTAGLARNQLLTSPTKSSGMLDSVIITSATAGAPITIWDATTTDSTLRNNTATSTLNYWSFQATSLGGTYKIGARFTNGLIVEAISTTTQVGVASSTITWQY